MLVCSNAGMQTTHLPQKSIEKFVSLFKNSFELLKYKLLQCHISEEMCKNILFLWGGNFRHNCENLKQRLEFLTSSPDLAWKNEWNSVIL
jgi:hypothetical protein